MPAKRRKPSTRNPAARKSMARKTTARKTTKRASRDVVANPNRTRDDYGFTYYPGQSSNRDVPLRKYEYSDTRTYTPPPLFSPEPLKDPPKYPVPTTTTTTPPTTTTIFSPETTRTPPTSTTVPITPKTTTEPPPPSTAAIPIPWDGWEPESGKFTG